MQRIARSPWADVWTTAGFAFLVIASVGALFLVGLKLQAPGLGAGASVPSVLAGIVISGLATLGVPTEVGDLTVTVVPMGGLLCVGAAVAWGAVGMMRRIDAPDTSQRIRWGAALGPCLALICGVAAFVFRIRDAAEPVSSNPLWSATLGLLWGSLFGAAGGLLSSRGTVRVQLAALTTRFGAVEGAARYSVLSLALALTLTAVATMAWIVLLLAGGPVGQFGPSDAAAAAVHFFLFLPNAITWVLAIALGAGVQLAAGLAGARRGADVDRVLSLWSWPEGTPWFAYLLLVIPVVATLGGGLAIARRGTTLRPITVVLASGMVGA
ncbi:MAG TPA: hypothetical protein VHJ82_01650, partial [Actinomycetota bacterium]|nr:hypothetical protein [Actinomycetota bacterium]